uniref:hypothetical protein n=1 Tax=Elmerina hispida TaxID=1245649 RepID=UPI003002DB96|nr:hypothetical protein [Elmerina hispida]
MSINKPETDIVNKVQLDRLLSSQRVFNIRELADDCFLVNYEVKMSRELALNSGFDYLKLLKRGVLPFFLLSYLRLLRNPTKLGSTTPNGRVASPEARTGREKKGDIENNKRLDFLSISTAAAITAYARIYINKIKL